MQNLDKAGFARDNVISSCVGVYVASSRVQLGRIWSNAAGKRDLASAPGCVAQRQIIFSGIGGEMDLTDEQKQAVEKWVDEGCGLAEIQKRFSDEFGISATYMDVRFLLIDLGLEVKEKEPAGPAEPAVAPELKETPAGQPGAADLAGGAGTSGVSVTVDKVTKPGSVVSGDVVFSDGVRGSWSLDQMGRLAISAEREGYNPSQEDLASFQEELKQELQRRGF